MFSGWEAAGSGWSPGTQAEGSCPGGAGSQGEDSEPGLRGISTPDRVEGSWSRLVPAVVLGDPRQCFWLWRLGAVLWGI